MLLVPTKYVVRYISCIKFIHINSSTYTHARTQTNANDKQIKSNQIKFSDKIQNKARACHSPILSACQKSCGRHHVRLSRPDSAHLTNDAMIDTCEDELGDLTSRYGVKCVTLITLQQRCHTPATPLI
jgi:hypothetical protein